MREGIAGCTGRRFHTGRRHRSRHGRRMRAPAEETWWIDGAWDRQCHRALQRVRLADAVVLYNTSLHTWVIGRWGSIPTRRSGSPSFRSLASGAARCGPVRTRSTPPPAPNQHPIDDWRDVVRLPGSNGLPAALAWARACRSFCSTIRLGSWNYCAIRGTIGRRSDGLWDLGQPVRDRASGVQCFSLIAVGKLSKKFIHPYARPDPPVSR